MRYNLKWANWWLGGGESILGEWNIGSQIYFRKLLYIYHLKEDVNEYVLGVSR